MKKLIIMALTTIALAGCTQSGDSGGGSNPAPVPTPTPTADNCNDANALNKNFVLPCICKGGYTVAADGKSCTSNGGNNGGGGGVVAPLTIFYPSNPVTYVVNVPILSPVAPSVQNCGGGVCTWTITPALPSGLSINPGTGAISGTPNTVTTSKNFTVTASNSAGQTVTSLNLGVINRPPTGLGIATSTVTYKVGTNISANIVSYTSEIGSVTSMSISPNLPAGLSFGEYTSKQWSITGNPTVNSPETEYTITATGPSGSATVKLKITTAAAPAGFAYVANNANCSTVSGTYTCNFRYREQFASIMPVITAGTSLTYSLVSVNGISAETNSLSSGLSVSGSSGALVTTTFGPLENTISLCGGAASYCTAVIKVSNPLGEMTTTVKFRVYSDAASIRYASNSYVLRILRSIETTIGTASGLIEAIQVGGDITCHGQPGCYTISPGLPANLSFSSLNGKISGSPAFDKKQAPVTYTVTAAGDANAPEGAKPTATFTLEIKERLPPAFFYTANGAYVFRKNLVVDIIPELDTTRLPGVCTTFDNIYPENPPIPLNTFSISPALPAGLTFNTGVFNSCEPSLTKGGVIQGTPTVYSPKTDYTISVCNDGGCSTNTINIEVAPEFVSVVTGDRHSCGIISEFNGTDRIQKVACWGANDLSQLGPVSTTITDTCTISGLGTIACSKNPVIVNVGSGTIKGLVAGKNHTCVIKDITTGDNDFNSIFCWGDNSLGQLGNGTTGGTAASLTLPTYSTNSANVSDSTAAVSAGHNATCFIRAELDDTGKVYCFGENYGNRAVQIGTAAQPVNQLYAESVVVGNNHACAVKVDVSPDSNSDGYFEVSKSGRAVCWGLNDRNQLGIGASSAAAFSTTPVQVKTNSSTDLTKIAQITSGEGHTCAVQDPSYPTASAPTGTKYVYCWGANDVGQIGTGSASASVGYASRVVGQGNVGVISSVSKIGSGAKQTYISYKANASDIFSLVNIVGQFALAGEPYTGLFTPTPVLMKTITTGTTIGNFQAADISPGIGPASLNHGCVIGSRNFVSCFGHNEAGQLGTGGVTNSILPTQLRYLLP